MCMACAPTFLTMGDLTAPSRHYAAMHAVVSKAGIAQFRSTHGHCRGIAWRAAIGHASKLAKDCARQARSLYVSEITWHTIIASCRACLALLPTHGLPGVRMCRAQFPGIPGYVCIKLHSLPSMLDNVAEKSAGCEKHDIFCFFVCLLITTKSKWRNKERTENFGEAKSTESVKK
jgi:hypothetical protein